MIYAFQDEENELDMGFAEVEFDIDFTPHAGCGPSWSEWSGGDPGYSPYITVDGFSVVCVHAENGTVKFADLDEDSKKKVEDWVGSKIDDDKFVNKLWDYIE
jgi:hypothetical protein